jgi:hypothetical protein
VSLEAEREGEGLPRPVRIGRAGGHVATPAAELPRGRTSGITFVIALESLLESPFRRDRAHLSRLMQLIGLTSAVADRFFAAITDAPPIPRPSGAAPPGQASRSPLTPSAPPSQPIARRRNVMPRAAKLAISALFLP